MKKIALTLVVLAVYSLTTTGCAALVVGYLVGDHMATEKRIEQCRSNLAAINQARIAKGEQPFPDQCK